MSDIAATAEGKQDLLELAVREHARMVYRIAYSVLRNHHDAEDATQETFLKVLRYRRRLEGVHDRKTWLARIAWRTAIDRREKATKFANDNPEIAMAQLRSSLAAADEVVVSGETIALLATLISGLPNQLRDAISLTTVQDLSVPEVAAILGIPEAAVRSRVFRARQLLKEKLNSLMGRQHGNTQPR